jgi:hypothetical protein
MKYHVFWSPDTEQRLEGILLAASDPSILTRAVREIDRELLSRADTFGESRYENVRVAFAEPLGIQFEVLEDVRTAIVFHVWRTDRMRR